MPGEADQISDGESVVVRGLIRPIVGCVGVIVVAQAWPCWLPVLVLLGIPVEMVYAPRVYDSVFADGLVIHELGDLVTWPEAWNQYYVFASGSVDFCRVLVDKLGNHVGPYIYAVDMKFNALRPRCLDNALSVKYPAALQALALDTTEVVHAKFGGVTSARHVIGYRNVDKMVFEPNMHLSRTLSHVIRTTISGVEIDPPPVLESGQVRRAPIRVDGVLRGEGLLDVLVLWTNPLVACKCVFKRSGWVQRHLSTEEVLNAFDVPLSLYDSLRRNEQALNGLMCGVSPLVTTSIVRAMWANSNGGEWKTGLFSRQGLVDRHMELVKMSGVRSWIPSRTKTAGRTKKAPWFQIRIAKSTFCICLSRLLPLFCQQREGCRKFQPIATRIYLSI